MMPSARRVLASRRRRAPETQLELEQRFFRQLRLPNGTYKATASRRLADVDQVLCGLLQGQPSPLSVLDTAVSSGITSLELRDLLTRHGWVTRLVATDVLIRGRLVGIPFLCDLLFDDAGQLLQLSVAGFSKPRPHAPGEARRRAALLRAFQLLERGAAASGLVGRGREVPLVSRLLEGASHVELERQDLALRRQDWIGRFSVVRAANILNRDYFPESSILEIAGHLLSYLRPGGLLCVCRTTEDGRNHATIWSQDADRTPEVVAQVGSGSEVASLVEAAARAPVGA